MGKPSFRFRRIFWGVLGAFALASLLAGEGAFAGAPRGSRPATGPMARLFRWLSQEKGNVRVLHTPGQLYQARFVPSSRNPLGLDPQAPLQATVRFSRGGGRLPPKKDILGLGVRLPGGAPGGFEDLTLVTAGVGSLTRRIPFFTADYFDREYSSLLPIERQGTRYLVRASANRSYNTVHLWLERLGGPSWGRYLELGQLRLGERQPEAANAALKLDPWSNAQLRPAGLINRLREGAYLGSQSTR